MPTVKETKLHEEGAKTEGAKFWGMVASRLRDLARVQQHGGQQVHKRDLAMHLENAANRTAEHKLDEGGTEILHCLAWMYRMPALGETTADHLNALADLAKARQLEFDKAHRAGDARH